MITFVVLLGCGGPDLGDPNDDNIIETPEIDSLISQIERAQADEIDPQSVGLLLQENSQPLAEMYPEHAAAAQELAQIGQQLDATGNKALLEQAKSKLESMK